MAPGGPSYVDMSMSCHIWFCVGSLVWGLHLVLFLLCVRVVILGGVGSK